MRISDHDADRLRVLKAIRRAEPVARTELVELTGLPAWAISELVADLLKRDLLVEERARETKRGRPRIQLKINPAGALVIGVVLAGDLRIEIADLRGEQLFGRTYEMELGLALDVLVDIIAAKVEETILDSPYAKAGIHSVGLGVAGLVGSDDGLLHWLPGYGRGPAPFAGPISERLGLPVNLDSLGNMYTRAEHWFGEDRQVDDFTLILVSYGMVSGQYVDGLLRTGDHGCNPEIAHVKVTPGAGPACHCGGRGCLETYCSIAGIVNRVAELRGIAPPPPIAPVVQMFRAFAEEARAGEATARQVFDFAAKALGAAVGNYINLWDPSRVVIVSHDRAWQELVEGPFRDAVHEATLPGLRGAAPIQFRSDGHVTFTQGAAALALEQLYLRSVEDRRSAQRLAGLSGGGP